MLGAFTGLPLLALPLAAQETAQAGREAGLKARGRAFWEARVDEPLPPMNREAERR